jgi:hypothetical protein
MTGAGAWLRSCVLCSGLAHVITVYYHERLNCAFICGKLLIRLGVSAEDDRS